MKTLNIKISCGEETCAEKPGKFYKFVRSKKFGQMWFCSLYEKELLDEYGWLRRCKKCKKDSN